VAVKLRLCRNTARRQRDDAHVKARRFESFNALCEVTEIQILAADLKIKSNGGRKMKQKSARHKRLLIEAASPNARITVKEINQDRSFGAKAFKHKKTKRKMARESRKINRAS